MIFVTVGSQNFQFDRLLRALDNLIGGSELSEEIFAQIGVSNYKPVHYPYKEFLNREDFIEWIDKSDVVITHGGTGTIISSIKRGKKVIAVPRMSRYREHVDNHQLQLIREFSKMGLIYECQNCDELMQAVSCVKSIEFRKYESHTEDFIKSIDAYIEYVIGLNEKEDMIHL